MVNKPFIRLFPHGKAVFFMDNVNMLYKEYVLSFFIADSFSPTDTALR